MLSFFPCKSFHPNYTEEINLTLKLWIKQDMSSNCLLFLHVKSFFDNPPLSFSLRLPCSVGGIRRRFMSQGKYLSVTDQPVLMQWQVSPSPPWGLSSPAWINSLCLAKWGLETHLLPERPSNNWGLVGNLYLKLCRDLAHCSK